MNFDLLYSELQNYIVNLENSYLSKHITNQLAAPSDYDLDVKSYCILSHAALEDFVETLAISVMNKAIDEYTNHHHISEPLITLMHFKSSGETYLNKQLETVEIITSYDYTRTKLIEIKSRFSKDIYNNHGVALKYIKQLLTPIAIDIPNDTLFLGSLEKLTKERGFYAHKLLERGSVRKTIAPEDAKKVVTDCLSFINVIKEKAKSF